MPKGKQEIKKSKILKGAALATAAGIAVGVTAVALSDKKTRSKIKKELKKLEKEGASQLDKIIKSVENAKSESKKKLKSSLENIEEKLE